MISDESQNVIPATKQSTLALAEIRTQIQSLRNLIEQNPEDTETLV